MKRKRKPSTGEISKYKARMNVDGSQMIKGLQYEETYAPVVQWATIRFLIARSMAYQTAGFCSSICPGRH
jgi:hypothetical protein